MSHLEHLAGQFGHLEWLRSATFHVPFSTLIFNVILFMWRYFFFFSFSACLYRDFSYLLNWYKSYLKESQRRITTQHEELSVALKYCLVASTARWLHWEQFLS